MRRTLLTSEWSRLKRRFKPLDHRRCIVKFLFRNGWKWPLRDGQLDANWVINNATNYQPTISFYRWINRAIFHFLWNILYRSQSFTKIGNRKIQETRVYDLIGRYRSRDVHLWKMQKLRPRWTNKQHPLYSYTSSNLIKPSQVSKQCLDTVTRRAYTCIPSLLIKPTRYTSSHSYAFNFSFIWRIKRRATWFSEALMSVPSNIFLWYLNNFQPFPPPRCIIYLKHS